MLFKYARKPPQAGLSFPRVASAVTRVVRFFPPNTLYSIVFLHYIYDKCMHTLLLYLIYVINACITLTHPIYGPPPLIYTYTHINLLPKQVMSALHLTVRPDHLLLHMARAPWWPLLSEVHTHIHTYICMLLLYYNIVYLSFCGLVTSSSCTWRAPLGDRSSERPVGWWILESGRHAYLHAYFIPLH